MITTSELRTQFLQIQEEGRQLAGGLNDLAQRAAVYHHLFEVSGGNHIFPLIAAHGALWARGYFKFGMQLSRILSWQFFDSATKRQTHLQQVEQFADAFRDINRKVCIDTYTQYHFTKRFGDHPDAGQLVNPRLSKALMSVHQANQQQTELLDSQKRDVYEAHFLNEQDAMVGPSIEQAVTDFDWPLAKWISLKPLVRFAYFPPGKFFWFHNFSYKQERIARGLKAFDLAAKVGWKNVEQSLDHYQVLPEEFFTDSAQHLDDLRSGVLVKLN
jgi:hypothetical protein